jgi:hypothetical protein
MKSYTVMALTMVLCACASPLPVLEAGPRASDPNAPVPRQRYAAVTVATKGHQPVDPMPWTEQNSEQKSDEESKSDADAAPIREAQ